MKKTTTSTRDPALLIAAKKAGLKRADISALRSWLAEQLVAYEHAKLGQGGHTQNQVPLCSVFVDLPVADNIHGRPEYEPRILFLEKLLLSRPLNLRHIYRPITDGNQSVLDITFDQFDLYNHRGSREHNFSATLLIGGPGQGKSTLSQLACQAHRAALIRPFEAELTSSQREIVRTFKTQRQVKSSKKKVSGIYLPSTELLPLQISLPDFAVWLTHNAHLETASGSPPLLIQFLVDSPAAKEHGLDAKTLWGIGLYLPTLIVLDGFDEVGAVHDRQKIVSAAKDFFISLSRNNASAQILATTRPQGYSGEFNEIGLPFVERYLTPLDQKEALEYAEKLVEAKIPDANEREKTLVRMREAANDPSTRRLLTTPLQVTILTALIQQQGRAPRERWNLFYNYFSYTYNREIERQTYASGLLSKHRSHIEQIHARVALLLQVAAESDGGASARMSRARLEEVIEAVLSEDEVSESDRIDLVREIAIAAEQRLVFLVEPEPGNFGFEIRSLQEFMAAWCITSGRDAEVEGRLALIAKAPMFRNVTLFVTSRLYSETSPLRDVIADQICIGLDENPEDEIARVTCAGALLALEILEEGAALSQPKRARALMKRATKLLTLPPSNEHSRIVQVTNDDTAPILRNAIAQKLEESNKQFTTDAAWLCLIEACNRNDTWAIELGEVYWPQISDTRKWLNLCKKLNIPLGNWITEKIEQTAEKFLPEDFVDLPIIPKSDNMPNNWVNWLSRRLGKESQERLVHSSIEHLSIANRLRLNISRQDLPESKPPEAWKTWVSIGLYESNPTSENLSTVLEEIAEHISPEKWSDMQWRTNWALASCLCFANTKEELLSLSVKIKSKILGDIDEWRQAEQSWSTVFDPFEVLDNASVSLPWTIDNIKKIPPITSLPIWLFSHHDHSNKSVAAQVLFNLTLEKLNYIFKTTPSAGLRRWIATACLFLLRMLPAKISKSNLQPLAWLEASPENIAFLVPRPRCLSQKEWLQLFDKIKFPEFPKWYFIHEEVFQYLTAPNIHPSFLRMAVLSLNNQTSRQWINDERSKEITNNLSKLIDESAITRVDKDLLELFLGSLPQEQDLLITATFNRYEKSYPFLWSSFFNAIQRSSLPIARRQTMLLHAYTQIGKSHDESNKAIIALRSIIQKRKSGLEDTIKWDELALPLPHPKHSALVRSRSAIPNKPIIFKRIDLQNVRSFNNLKLQLSTPPNEQGQWLVILGPNGIGKTTILRSIALGLRNTKDLTIWPKGTFSTPWQRITSIEDERLIDTRISITMDDDIEHLTLIRSSNTLTVTQLPELQSPRIFPLFAYGCRRGSALGGVTRQVNLKDGDGPEIATLFDDSADLIHAETWLIQLDGDVVKNPKSRIIYDAVISGLKKLLDVNSIDVIDKQVWVTEHKKPRLPLNSLSDGYLTSAGWFLDLIARWIDLAEINRADIQEDFFSQMRGVVLIDEIDLHLHPRWQIEIISRTRNLLPQMSFIVTTHNPLTLVGARADEILILSDVDGGIVASSGVDAPMLLTGGQIYRRYFGIENIYPNDLGSSLQRYGFLVGYAERNDQEQSELDAIQEKLSAAGINPNWEIVPRVNSLKKK